MAKFKTDSGKPRSRLQDHFGNYAPIDRLIRNGPKAVISGFGRLALDYRPPVPWISYDARDAIAARLSPTSRVLEFGSGMSTIWLAKRAGQVISIEGYKPWYDKVSVQLARRGLANVDYRFATDAEAYARPFGDDEPESFDLILVDGNVRDRCVENGLALLAPRGIMYVDNSDRGPPPPDNREGDMPRARRLLEQRAREVGGTITSYTDFAPTLFFAIQGLLYSNP